MKATNLDRVKLILQNVIDHDIVFEHFSDVITDSGQYEFRIGSRGELEGFYPCDVDKLQEEYINILHDAEDEVEMMDWDDRYDHIVVAWNEEEGSVLFNVRI